MKNGSTPRLVAHRGYSQLFPENTLLSFEQALSAGACMIECDVQLTRDQVPVILHDAELSRTTGSEGNVHELEWSDLASTNAGYQQRFGEQFDGITIPLLADFVALMQRWPTRKAFVEIKRSSIRKFGRDKVLQQILPLVTPVKQQIVIISFDFELMAIVKEKNQWQTGWVIEDWNEQNLQLARQLDPRFLFVDHECLPANLALLPEATWQWVLYEIDDAQAALYWTSKGATFIETNDIGRLLQLPEFSAGRCNENSVL